MKSSKPVVLLNKKRKNWNLRAISLLLAVFICEIA
jgi:hypothetical protein